MHTICSPYGTVLRIVIFKKNGVQAMVEYPWPAYCTVVSVQQHLRSCSSTLNRFKLIFMLLVVGIPNI